jgi:hypothetical protein
MQAHHGSRQLMRRVEMNRRAVAMWAMSSDDEPALYRGPVNCCGGPVLSHSSLSFWRTYVLRVLLWIVAIIFIIGLLVVFGIIDLIF